MDKLKLLQEAYAVAQRTGRSADASRVRAQIETIKRDAPTTITPEVDRSLELSNIERLLYQPDLTGADAAFRRLQDLEARDRDAGRDPKFAVLRAAALGQIYERVLGQDPRDAALPGLVRDAIAAIRQAQKLGQSEWLRYLATPDSTDNDLVKIAEVPEVRAEIFVP